MDAFKLTLGLFSSLVVLSICDGASLVDISPYFTKILDKHNEVRREVAASNMQYLQWDDLLKQKAEDWAKKCRYERPGVNRHMFSRYNGHNLFYTQSNTHSWHRISRTIDRGLNSWAWEKQSFKYGKDCGNACSYSQMVWAKSNKIGCALSYCDYLRAGKYWVRHASLFVCYYSPRGNMVGNYPYLGGAVCSNCPYGTKCNKGGLCSPPVFAEYRAPAEIRLEERELQETPPTETSLEWDSNIYRPLDIYGPNRGPSPRYDPRSRNVVQTECVETPRQNPRYNPRDNRRRNPRQNRNPYCRTSLTQDEENLILEITNQLRARKARQQLVWSSEIKEWANYVIRCDREYPGPRTAYTNFGKILTTRGIQNLVFKWGSEGENRSIKLKTGCRTPNDHKKCNHNTNLMEYKVNRMACAACNCGQLRQLTCIYDNKH